MNVIRVVGISPWISDVPSVTIAIMTAKFKGMQVGTTRFIVMRHPTLMEDEGRHSFVKLFTSKTKAKEWIAAQKDEYFKPEDYYICEESV